MRGIQNSRAVSLTQGGKGFPLGGRNDALKVTEAPDLFKSPWGGAAKQRVWEPIDGAELGGGGVPFLLNELHGSFLHLKGFPALNSFAPAQAGICAA